MKSSCYLILNKVGVVGFRKSKPHLTSGQIAIKLDLDVSDKFFTCAMCLIDFLILFSVVFDYDCG